VVTYLDRVNVSFAQLQLEDDFGFSDTIFGIGAGIFSIGYGSSVCPATSRWSASAPAAGWPGS
jgi:sugar phosphate permease